MLCRYASILQRKLFPTWPGAELDGGLFTMSDLLLASKLADIKAVNGQR